MAAPIGEARHYTGENDVSMGRQFPRASYPVMGCRWLCEEKVQRHWQSEIENRRGDFNIGKVHAMSRDVKFF